MQRQVNICISIVVVAVALSIGLIAGIHFRPPEIHSDQEIYRFVAVVFICIVLFIIGIIFFLKKIGYWEKIIDKLTEKEK